MVAAENTTDEVLPNQPLNYSNGYEIKKIGEELDMRIALNVCNGVCCRSN